MAEMSKITVLLKTLSSLTYQDKPKVFLFDSLNAFGKNENLAVMFKSSLWVFNIRPYQENLKIMDNVINVTIRKAVKEYGEEHADTITKVIIDQLAGTFKKFAYRNENVFIDKVFYSIPELENHLKSDTISRSLLHYLVDSGWQIPVKLDGQDSLVYSIFNSVYKGKVGVNVVNGYEYCYIQTRDQDFVTSVVATPENLELMRNFIEHYDKALESQKMVKNFSPAGLAYSIVNNSRQRDLILRPSFITRRNNGTVAIAHRPISYMEASQIDLSDVNVEKASNCLRSVEVIRSNQTAV